jgi:hypothetical protein
MVFAHFLIAAFLKTSVPVMAVLHVVLHYLFPKHVFPYCSRHVSHVSFFPNTCSHNGFGICLYDSFTQTPVPILLLALSLSLSLSLAPIAPSRAAGLEYLAPQTHRQSQLPLSRSDRPKPRRRPRVPSSPNPQTKPAPSLSLRSPQAAPQA